MSYKKWRKTCFLEYQGILVAAMLATKDADLQQNIKRMLMLPEDEFSPSSASGALAIAKAIHHTPSQTFTDFVNWLREKQQAKALNNNS